MLCNLCHKHEAMIHFKGVMNGRALELDLCEECARTKSMEFTPSPDIAELVSSLADLGGRKRPRKEPACPACGMTYAQFKRAGRVGCGECYRAFAAALLPLIKRIQGRTRHAGKAPGQAPAAVAEAAELRKRLEEALRTENYEKAARLRDRLKQLEADVPSAPEERAP